MEGYQLGTQLYEDENLHLRVFDLIAEKREGLYAVKQYTCTTCDEADHLLKEALTLSRQTLPLWASLIEVRLETVDSEKFTVNYIFKKFDQEFNHALMTKNDRDTAHEVGLQGYDKRKQLMKKTGDINVKVNEGWAETQQCEVIIKTFSSVFQVEKINFALKEAVVQAHLQHPNNCCIIEVALRQKLTARRGFKLHLVMEKLSRDVEADIKKRYGNNQTYSEKELLAFLSQVTAGLNEAKSKVRPRQKIAHRDIKPSNIFVGTDDTYKVGDFGSAWEKTLQSLTISPAGTVQYLSPEMRVLMLSDNPRSGERVDSFACDVYSLGVTLIHLGTLQAPQSLSTTDLSELQSKIEAAVASLQYSEQLKTLITQMLSINPAQRPIVEDVLQTVNALLGLPKLGDSGIQWWAMTREQLAVEKAKVLATIRTLEQSERWSDQSDAYLQAAEICKAENSFEKAEKFALKCSALRRDTFGSKDPRTAQVDTFIAILYYRSMARFAEAKELCLKSLQTYESVGYQQEIASSCLFLCDICRTMGQYSEAEQVGVRSQRLHERLYGENHHATAAIYNSLALVYWKMGRLEDAERLAQKNLRVHKSVYSETHAETAKSYNTLYLIYKGMLKLQEAEECALKALQIWSSVFGQIHPDVAVVCNNLCRLYQDTGRLEQAKRYGEKSLSAKQQLYGNIHPATATTIAILATVYRDMGHLQLAEEFVRNAISIWETLPGTDPSALATARGNLEDICQRRRAASLEK